MLHSDRIFVCMMHEFAGNHLDKDKKKKKKRQEKISVAIMRCRKGATNPRPGIGSVGPFDSGSSQMCRMDLLGL